MSKYQKMVLWSCEAHEKKKCQSDYPCQMILTACTNVTKKTCSIGKKGNWVKVPTSELTQ